MVTSCAAQVARTTERLVSGLDQMATDVRMRLKDQAEDPERSDYAPPGVPMELYTEQPNLGFGV